VGVYIIKIESNIKKQVFGLIFTVLWLL